jgi:hypothetical protein
MRQIDYRSFSKIPPGSKPIIEEIAQAMEGHGLVAHLGREHIPGLPLEPRNLISMTAWSGGGLEALASCAEGTQFQDNLRLLKNLCLVVKDLYSRGAVGVEWNYNIGDPTKGEHVSMDFELDYRNMRVWLAAMPNNMTIYCMSETDSRIVTGYQNTELGPVIEELTKLLPKQIAAKIQSLNLQLPSKTD